MIDLRCAIFTVYYLTADCSFSISFLLLISRMYCGHFALIPVLKKYYPNVPSYVFSIGVVFLDILFATLAIVGLEGFSVDNEGSVLGVNIHCNYTHSLVGSLLLSFVYGKLTGYFVPGFIAAFSHFVTDWLVHNDDLYLDPVSKIVVGGTGIWSKYPTLAHYLENGLCLVCILLTFPDTRLMLPNVLSIIFNLVMFPIIPQLYHRILSFEQVYARVGTCLVVIALFLIPAALFTFILDSGNRKKVQKKQA